MKKSLLLLALLFFATVASITAQVVNVSGDITTNTTWTKNNSYLLNGFVYVKNGAILTIEPGTVIKGDKASRASLIITRGARIIADGTFNEPIVFTSNESIPAAGDWGGLIILGRASTNGSFSGTVGLQAIEGDINNANGDGLFGNGDLAGPATQYDNDNSGILRYVRIEYPGVVITPGNEINGLTMGGVGRGTTMDYVQVSFSNDDSFEWFGGNVNAKHLIAYRGLDDDFDTDNGFSGTIQFAFSQRDPAVSDAAGASNSFESDNDANATTATPKTAANFVNVTIVGPSTVDAAQFFSRGALLRRNTEQALFNCLIVGAWPNAGLRIDGTNTGANATAGTLEVKNLLIAGATTPVNTNAAGFDVNAWFATAGWGNQSFPASGDAKLTDPFNLNAPNLVPQVGSPVLTAGSFTSSPRIQNNPYVIKVGYVGAFSDNDWTCGWARFAGGSTPCGATVVSGNITTNTTWTKNNTYVLNGFVYVKNCATLTIEPGTVIKGDKATRGTLIVTRCAKIVADGTFNEPIVFTSSSATPAAGDWGGLVILGRATTNGSFNGTVGLQAIEGDLNNAAGDGLFGNGDLPAPVPATQYENDNSGILRYVRIEYPGIVITPGNEINGLTLGGVGRGTTMDYVQVSYSNDDSYEWFGGNVNAKHLIAYRGLDDDFDTDNGFSGNIQFAFSVRDPQVSDAAGASNSFESDNDANATEAAPKTSATFSNVTVVGPSTVDATQFFSRGALLRRNTNQALFNTLIIGAWPNAGLRIDGTNTGANATAGTLEVKNTIIAGPATAVNTNAAGFDVNAWFGTTGWGNQSFPASADAKLTDPFNLNTPNLLPLAGSPVLNASNFAATRVNNANFIKVPYVGAFGDNDWTCGWARFAGGATPCAPTVISGNITTNTTWTKNNTYVLNGFVYVKNCATLTIEPGTVIKGDKATRGTLIVTRCAKIVADGTFNEPIVFTSSSATPAAGDWGGLVILGRATTNGSFNGTVGLQAIEGDLNNASGDGLFGNGDLAGPATQYDNDNSGILRYVRIEYPGIVITSGNEINGLTLGGVGRGTTMDYVQVSYSNDDSYEWFGGNVNAKHLIAYRGLDDDFDTDNGFSGNIQFAFSVRDPQVSDAAGASNSFESDNDANATEAAPKTAATFSNVTVVGPSTADAAQFFSRGALLRRNTNQSLFNTLIIGAWPNAGLRIDGTTTGANATAGTLEAKNIIIAGPATAVNTNAAGFDVNAWFGTAGWGNQSFPASADAKLTDPFNLNTPNLIPLAGSPVLNASNFAAARVNNANFIKVPYVGAFGDNDWTCGWARFAGGATPCAATVVSGNITTNTTWTKDNEYILNGFVYVKNCATLTIEPGTVIKGDKATRGTLIVTRCAKIVADGTRNQPIVFTSSSATPVAGDWGGLVILGRATTNGSFNGTVGLQAIEGDLNNAAGDGLFGNGDLPTPSTQYDNDNSGILRYVRIEYPGIVITSGNEINGLTLGGVGRGTTLDYVQVSFSNDDSYEWFGGNVNAKHLIAYRGLDDDFDTDNGFSGNIQFAFSVRDPQVSDAAGASNSFESDNDANATEAAPKTAATFSNVTVVGPSTADAAQFFSRGALLRRNTNQSLFNTLIVGAWPNAGLRIDGTTTGANATAGTLEAKNIIIAGAATAVNTNAAGFDVNAWFGTAGWGNQSFPTSADAKLTDPFNLNTPNLVPLTGSPALNASSFTATRINNANFIKVPYVGAFGDIDWTCGWARFSGGVGPCAPEVISGDITTNTTWTNAKEYTLNGFVYVKNCATLTIEPGTVIKGDKATRGTLIVSRCSKIVADGTADAPIVFTSSSATPTAGDWGGLVILGRASTNGSFNGTVGLQAIEGDLNNASGDGLFGNGDLAGPATQYDNDNSGILRYVRIEYPGIVITSGNEINGLTMGGVGRGTTMDYVQVSYSNDDSYEWFGGNVNAKHLIAYRGLDDDFDTDNGFSGNLQFLLGVKDPQVSDAAGASNGFESDNDANATSATPKTAATITNATMIAPATVDATQFFSRGALLRRNTEQSIFNTIFVGAWPNAGIRIDGNNTGANATANLLEVKNVSIAGAATAVNTNAAGFDVASWYATNGWNNQSFPVSGDVQLTNPFNVDLPNAVPNLLSPVLNFGSFVSSPRLNNSFFTTVNYSGAFGRTNGSINDWTCKWADFKGGAADCLTSTDDFNKVVNTLKLFPTVTGDYTNLEIDLKENVNLNVTIYGMNGTNFGTLLDENVAAGNQVIGLNVSNLTAGFYFVQIQAGNAIKTEKLIIVR